MLTGRLAFSTHKQQIYCILCHGQNQFSVSVAVAVSVWSCLSAYVAYQLRSVSVSALVWGPGSGSGWGSRCFAEPAPKIAGDFESMMLMLVKMMSMSQCRWHLSPRRKTRDRQPEERVQLELLLVLVLLLLLLIRQLLLLTKNQFNWINFVEFLSVAAALSVHIRFSTLFPCHFRAQILFRRFRELSSFILRQEFCTIYYSFYIYMGFLFRKNFLGMHKSNCKWWISIAFWYLSSISFVRHETKFLRQFGMKFARNEYPSSGGNTSIWHVHSFTTNRKRS